MNGLLVVGAGGHGKVVADTAYSIGRWDKIAFLDDRYASIGNVLNGPVLGPLNQAASFLSEYAELVVAIGDNYLRVNLLRKFEDIGFRLPTLVHPTAFVSRAASLKPGTVVLSQAAVNAGAKVGFGCIINTAATVDHDCVLGTGVHVCPGAHLGGEVSVGDYSWLGIGSTIIHKISIGEKVIIGAGTVVIKQIENNVTVFGVPGRVVKKND